MQTATLVQKTVIGGLTIQSSFTREGEGVVSVSAALPAGKAGTLSTRTNHTEGTCTLAAEHGITTAAIVDLYWATGKRRGVTVGTVSGTSVPITGGAGDNLPTQTTAIVMSVQVPVAIAFSSSLIKLMLLSCDQRASLDFFDAAVDGSSVLSSPIDLPEAGAGFGWADNSGVATPFNGSQVLRGNASNGSSTTAAALTGGILINSV